MISDHIAMLSRLGIEREISTGLLKFIEIDSPLMSRPIGIVRRDNEPISPAIGFIIRTIEEVCARRYRSGKTKSSSSRP
jgi:DNA-binding transcriptional LysR family regulator